MHSETPLENDGRRRRRTRLIYRDPEGLITLASLGISERVKDILGRIDRIAARQAMDFLREEALGPAGEAFFRAIGGMLPIDISGIPGSLGGTALGNEFDELLSNDNGVSPEGGHKRGQPGGRVGVVVLFDIVIGGRFGVVEI